MIFLRAYTIDGRERPPAGREPSAGFQVVTPGYFGAMGIPILSGRDFNAGDVRGALRSC